MVYAESNLRKGNRLEAMKAYQKVIKIKPEVPDVRNALTRIYLSLNHFKDAYNELVKVFELDPKNIEAHLLLKKLVRKSEIPVDLKEVLEPHLEFKASPSRIAFLKKQFQLEKKKHETLVNDYERQLEEDDGNPIIMFNKSKAEERFKFAEETLQDLDTMIGEVEEEDIIYPTLEKPQEVELPAEEEVTETEGEEEALIIEDEEVPQALSIGVDEEGEDEDSGFIPEIGGASEDELFEAMEDGMEEPAEEKVPDEIVEEQVEEQAEELAEETPEEPVEDIEVEVPDIPGSTEEQEPKAEVSEPEKTEEPKEASIISDERMLFYDEMEGQMSKLLKTLNRTRGVTSSLIMDNTGYILSIESTEEINTQEFAIQVLDGVNPLLEWGKSEGDQDRELLYWVLEFKKGLMVLQPLTREIFMVVLGKRGANFGAVRYSIEKNIGRLVLSLQDMPA